MLSYTIGDFIDKDCDEGGCSLYVVRKEDQILYVGCANSGISRRWFDYPGSHLLRNIYGEWFGGTAVGEMIARNLPTSREWMIDIYALEDCYDELPDFNNIYVRDIFNKRAEIELIHKLKPSLNVYCIGE